jgi:predicted DNA-binding transcriptional regulator AlpA
MQSIDHLPNETAPDADHEREARGQIAANPARNILVPQPEEATNAADYILQLGSTPRSRAQQVAILLQLARELETDARGGTQRVARVEGRGPVAKARDGPLSTLEHLPAHLARHRVLSTAEAAAFCGFSDPHWRRLYRTGRAPPPIQQSLRKYGWQVGTLIDHLASLGSKA